MKIDAYLTPYYPETESLYDGATVVIIDVLRASTTVCAALLNGAKEVITCESLDKAVTVFNNLSKENRYLGGERNGEMPPGFNAGNSPAEYTRENIEGKSIILATTNGTKSYQKARQAERKIVGCFANFSLVAEYLAEFFSNPENSEKKLVLLAAGTNGRMSYEDTLCAGAFIDYMKRRFEYCESSDSANMAMNLYNLHKSDLKAFLSECEHARHLKNIGFESDLDLCLEFDHYPVIPIISGSSIKPLDTTINQL